MDIGNAKVDIEGIKVDIRNKLLSFSGKITEKTIIVEEVTRLKSSGASKLIKLLLDSDVIIPVTGLGKGKYRFAENIFRSKEQGLG